MGYHGKQVIPYVTRKRASLLLVEIPQCTLGAYMWYCAPCIWVSTLTAHTTKFNNWCNRCTVITALCVWGHWTRSDVSQKPLVPAFMVCFVCFNNVKYHRKILCVFVLGMMFCVWLPRFFIQVHYRSTLPMKLFYAHAYTHPHISFGGDWNLLLGFSCGSCHRQNCALHSRSLQVEGKSCL